MLSGPRRLRRGTRVAGPASRAGPVPLGWRHLLNLNCHINAGLFIDDKTTGAAPQPPRSFLIVTIFLASRFANLIDHFASGPLNAFQGMADRRAPRAILQ